MKYLITLHYMDGKTVDVSVEREKLDYFYDCIGKFRVFYNEDTGKGIWFHIDKVRYFTVLREEEEEDDN